MRQVSSLGCRKGEAVPPAEPQVRPPPARHGRRVGVTLPVELYAAFKARNALAGVTGEQALVAAVAAYIGRKGQPRAAVVPVVFLHYGQPMPERPPGSPPFPLSPLYELKDWVLDIRCGQCRKRTRIPVQLLAERLGSKFGIMQVVIRLRCDRPTPPPSARKCGGKPDLVALLRFDMSPKRPVELERVTVLGDVPIW